MSSPLEIRLLPAYVPASPQSTTSDLLTTPPTSPETNLEHTPYSKTNNSSSRSATGSLKVEETYRRSAYESTKWILGPMPYSEFLNEFLPLLDTVPPMPSSEGAFDSVPDDPSSESELYNPIVAALNDRLTIFKCVDTSKISENGTKVGSLKPDISIYMNGLTSSYTNENNTPFGKFRIMELFAEVKKTADQDPFRDGSPEIIDFNLDAPYDDLPKATKRKIDILGQSVCYATTILAQQHRQFAYSMMISGTMVRFLRWDRAGAIVSQAFDCRKEPDVLCQFMWRLEHLSMAQRGFDTTVVQGSTEDYGSIFSDAIKNRVCFELDIPHQGAKADKALKQHYDPDQLSIVTVSEGSINKTYCICRPLEAPLSVVGRATRGYWSVDVTTGEVRFLKDTWRKDLAGLEYEGNVVRELSKQGVQNVPKLDCHGDVISDGKVQDTKTQDYIGARWVRRSLSQEQLKQHIVKHTHYRMVSETVGCSLHEHQNLGELMSAASDVYQCILDANQLCQRLHRDISANNIILVRDPATGVRNGVAIDWELSIKTARPKVANYTISGTWQFISYRLLQRTDTTPHRIVDDLESLFWVVCWFLLLYYADFSVKILASRLSGIFDHFRYEAGHFVGGEGKVNILVDQTSVVSGFQDPIVVEWITKYAKFLFNAIMAPKDRVPDTMGLESVFCLVGKMPQGVLKQVPDWKELKTYRPLGAHQLLPPTISWSSVAAMSESGMAIQPSQTTGSEAPAHIPEENAGEEEGEAGEGAK